MNLANTQNLDQSKQSIMFLNINKEHYQDYENNLIYLNCIKREMHRNKFKKNIYSTYIWS